MTQSSAKPSAKELVLRQLRSPLKLRVILCVFIIAAWYLFFFMPLSDQTQATTARTASEGKRIATAKEIEKLKKTMAPYAGLIPAGANASELMRHVIDHLRSSRLKLIDMKPEAPKDLGPYETVGIQLAIEGQFPDIDAFLSWAETDERQLRVDTIKIDPNQQVPGLLKAQITLLSMAEKSQAVAKPKADAGKSADPKTAK
jgi:Tfp pilus assembly protein PilO